MLVEQTSSELEVLKTVSDRLNKAHLPYMITGSIAANFYAVPRMTRDIDIVVELHERGADKIVSIFQDDFYVEPESVSQAIRKKDMFNIIHNDFIVKVDFIVRKASDYRELEFSRRREVEIEGVKMWIVSPEDLVLSKLFWAKESLSELQLGDVRNILDGVSDIDVEYIKKWVGILGLGAVYEKVKI